ncbi:MAG: hypothetical protein D6677_01935 [Calditrichaeota bacterium]|nr:MAG: hypothetical protein D6677_01935 [Calditrichota bacterium]
MKKLIVFIAMFSGYLAAQTASEALDLTSVQDGVGIRALGMGNAYSAVADDYTAVYWNPAGLGQIKKFTFNVNLAHGNHNTASSYIDRHLESGQTTTRLNAMGFAYPFDVYRGSFVLGFGYQVNRNFDAYNRFSAFSTESNGLSFEYDNGDDIPFDRNVQQDYTISNEGKLNSWNLAAAMALSPKFTVGVNLAFVGGQKDFGLDYVQTDVDNRYVLGTNQLDFYSYQLEQRLHQTFSATELKLAGMFELTRMLKLSTVIIFPTSMNVKEEWSQKDKIVYDDTSVPVDEYDLGTYEFDYIIRTPYRFNAGLSWHSDILTLAASAEYADWSQLRYDVPDGRDRSEYDDLLLENQTIREDFKPALAYSAGGELALLNRTLFLRAGYSYQPVADRTLDKSRDLKRYHAGIGYAVDGNTMLNVAYAIGKVNRDMRYIYTTSTVREEINKATVRIGITYRFE